MPTWYETPLHWKCINCETSYMSAGDIRLRRFGYTKSKVAPEEWYEGVDEETSSTRD
jgi:hypothetical protein